jgi:hypothetical protein
MLSEIRVTYLSTTNRRRPVTNPPGGGSTFATQVDAMRQMSELLDVICRPCPPESPPWQASTMTFKVTFSDGQESDYDDGTTEWVVEDAVLKMGREAGKWTVLISPSHWATIEVLDKDTAKDEAQEDDKDDQDDKDEDQAPDKDPDKDAD